MMGFSASQLFVGFLFQFVVLSCLCLHVSSFGSMSSIAISFGDKGSAFCVLKPDGSQTVTCNGSNPEIVHGVPPNSQFLGLTGGSDFVCGLLVNSAQPYCWGSNNFIRERVGVPQPMVKGAQYSEISAGANHLCGLRKPLKREMRQRNSSFVDCWGNRIVTHVFDDVQIQSISAGCEFNCGLFSQNKTVLCWGNDTYSPVIQSIPRGKRFRQIAAGFSHVCGILEGLNSTLCWGNQTNLLINQARYQGSILKSPSEPMTSVVSGMFHSCGIKSHDLGVICWGSTTGYGVEVPTWAKFTEIAAGNYFTCGILAEKSHGIVCWGIIHSGSVPIPGLPGKCASSSCPLDYYEMKQNKHHPCNSTYPHLCFPCSGPCSNEMYQTSGCNLTSDRICAYNCSNCFSSECFSHCSSLNPGPVTREKHEGFSSKRVEVVAVAEFAFAASIVFLLSVTLVLYAKYKLRYCKWFASRSNAKKLSRGNSSSQRENNRIRPDSEELGHSKAKRYTYEELERATDGFKEDSIVGKGSSSRVFKGVLEDGTVVAVKREILSSNRQRNANDFQRELDLLSRLNHAHLLSLLGYCEEGGEIILVYEFMAHGSLHKHLHGQNKELKTQLDWVRRVTIAVQAARGIEYLHGYACPPVIHRDIKSSNILIDEEHNARLADFGLSLLGPADSSTPLSELPAGTFGYLDPEYYRLHNLTTKSDVYSFGILLLELLSGRKAIDMQCEEGNIAQWAKPLIKSGDIAAILDPVLPPPPDLEALKKVAIVACKSVSSKGRDRPSMDNITTELERALAQLMGTEQPILPTEVVLGSSRMQMRSSQRSSNRSEIELTENEDNNKRLELTAPLWKTFPSLTISQRIIIKSSSSSEPEADVKNNNNAKGKNNDGGIGGSGSDVLTSLEEEIGPASPEEKLFLQHNFYVTK